MDSMDFGASGGRFSNANRELDSLLRKLEAIRATVDSISDSLAGLPSVADLNATRRAAVGVIKTLRKADKIWNELDFGSLDECTEMAARLVTNLEAARALEFES